MTSRAPRRDPWDDEHRLELVEGRVDANITDQRRLERKLDKLSDRTREGFQFVNLRLDAMVQMLNTASTKASAANHRAVRLEARQSLTEEQVRQALDDVAATSRAIVANPPEGDELKALQREVLRGARPLAGKLGWALMAFLIAALVYGAAAFTSCSPGGF